MAGDAQAGGGGGVPGIPQEERRRAKLVLAGVVGVFLLSTACYVWGASAPPRSEESLPPLPWLLGYALSGIVLGVLSYRWTMRWLSRRRLEVAAIVPLCYAASTLVSALLARYWLGPPVMQLSILPLLGCGMGWQLARARLERRGTARPASRSPAAPGSRRPQPRRVRAGRRRRGK
jgi:hypothetical protein